MHGSRPSADCAWLDFWCSGVQDGGFDKVDGGGRAGGVAAGNGGDPAAIHWSNYMPYYREGAYSEMHIVRLYARVGI